MPKISAPTVAEHRANRRASLLRAGEAVLREEGLAGVTPGSVCERAGLARTSFYDYFTSKEDLLFAIALAAIEAWEAEIEQELATVEAGLPALRAFVQATMSMTAEGRHDIANVLQDVQFEPARMDDLMAVHDTLLRPLVRILTDLAVPAPESTALLVQGVLNTGVQLVSHGNDPHTVTDDVLQLLTHGVVARN